MRFLALLLLATGLLSADNSLLTKAEAQTGWILLFDGESQFGWTREGETSWVFSNGVVTPNGESGWLRTTSAFADFVFTCEFRGGPGSDSGVFLRTETQHAVFQRSEAQRELLEKGYKIQRGHL